MNINPLQFQKTPVNTSFKNKDCKLVNFGQSAITNRAVIDLYSPEATRLSSALKAKFAGITFNGTNIGGVIYSDKAQMLGDNMLKPEEAKALFQASLNKIEEVKFFKLQDKEYNNSRMGVVEAATALGENNKSYTACNVDFYSSRWGLSAGTLAACMALNDFNDKIKAVALTSENHDRRALQLLANTSNTLNKTRGGENLQVVTAKKETTGKTQLYVRTLSEVPGFIPSEMPRLKPEAVPINSGITEYKPEQLQIKSITYSPSAQLVADKLATEKGFNTNEFIKNLVLKAQEEANNLDKSVVETKGYYDNAPVSHFRYISAVIGNNNKVYTGYNTEFYDNGFLVDIMCSERTAASKAVNDGAQSIYALALISNQNHKDLPCGECLGWLSTPRAGKDLLIATVVRDDKGNKTNQVAVKTLNDFLTDPHTSSLIAK